MTIGSGSMLALALLAAPATTPAPTPPVVAAPTYDDAQAHADARTLMDGEGRAYLDARARLERHPELAAKALVAQLVAPTPPNEAQRARLLHALAQFRSPAHVDLFAAELRVLAQRIGDVEVFVTSARPWRDLLQGLGVIAAPAFSGLVADTNLSIEIRSLALDDLVRVSDVPALVSLVKAAGSSDPNLAQQLRTSLLARSKADPEVRARLIEASRSTSPVNPWLLALRSALQPGTDREFSDELRRYVADQGVRFGVRVAALRILTRHDATSDDFLATFASGELTPARRSTQTSEILGWLALRTMKPQAARPVVDRLALRDAISPRLAQLGWQLGSLPTRSWLGDSQRHPWPEVRAAAIGRIAAPCDESTMRRLADIAGPEADGGDDSPRVTMAAVRALGGCGTNSAMSRVQKILFEGDAHTEARAEAGAQLVRRGDESTVAIVASALQRTSDDGLASRLAQVFADAPPTDEVREALCATRKRQGPAADAARKSLIAVFGADAEARDPDAPVAPRDRTSAIDELCGN